MTSTAPPETRETNGRLPCIAYFCMEYGLSEHFPIYSGGLGVLAGDFVKSAGDLALPVVAVGLRWAAGTSQVIGPDDFPVDEWHEYRPDCLEDTGVRVRVRIKSREVECIVWRVTRYVSVPLFLLEPSNHEDRWITERLYDTRPDCRVAQEMVLGIGGMRALPRLGYEPDIYHFNEGHAVFAGLELIASRMANNASFQEALAEARAKIVFTTHTPVPAGNETHSITELRRLGATLELVDAEVREIGGDPFNMTVAGLKLSFRANAVSKLHAVTAREMWRHVAGAAPIIAITNGVHQATWQSPAIAATADDPARLWKEHVDLKHELLEKVQKRNGVYLEPGILTIGFARRAAAYKRADLILRDPARLRTLLEKRRIQIIFSGKAHAADHAGKQIIQKLVKFARDWPNAVVFIENYDMAIARSMVRGCDVWLNNPYRPQEASGTSGMKAAMNGVLNLSILDGWWPEGCIHGVNGWAIDGGGTTEGAARDEEDLNSLLDTLEGEVLETFIRRDDWVRLMQASIRMATAHFTSDRMVRQYFADLYLANTVQPAYRNE